MMLFCSTQSSGTDTAPPGDSREQSGISPELGGNRRNLSLNFSPNIAECRSLGAGLCCCQWWLSTILPGSAKIGVGLTVVVDDSAGWLGMIRMRTQ
jgi:hypothetical protein